MTEVPPGMQCECGSGLYWDDCHSDYEEALVASGELDDGEETEDYQDPELYK